MNKSVLDTVPLDSLADQRNQGVIRDSFRLLMWACIENNPEQETPLRRYGLFGPKLRFKDLHAVFALILGPKPFFLPS